MLICIQFSIHTSLYKLNFELKEGFIFLSTYFPIPFGINKVDHFPMWYMLMFLLSPLTNSAFQVLGKKKLALFNLGRGSGESQRSNYEYYKYNTFSTYLIIYIHSFLAYV